MKSILFFLSAVMVFGAGCQPAGVGPPAANPPAMPAQATASSVAIWVAVDDPGELRSPPEIFRMAEQRVVPNLKKLPGTAQVQILGSEQQLAISDEMPTVLIKVSLPGKGAAAEFRQAMTGMESLPVAVNVVLDETLDPILTVEVLAVGSNREQTRKTAQQAMEILEDMPDVAGVVTYFDTDKANVATMLVQQTGERPTTAEVRQALERDLAGVQINVTTKQAAP